MDIRFSSEFQLYGPLYLPAKLDVHEHDSLARTTHCQRNPRVEGL
uniref:Uncharacterized protein n=1 Tax=Arundo donax TaxID=35708 RepID=A0A0A9FDD1_ARUDO